MGFPVLQGCGEKSFIIWTIILDGSGHMVMILIIATKRFKDYLQTRLVVYIQNDLLFCEVLTEVVLEFCSSKISSIGNSQHLTIP